ncbi:MAG: hypothetical protein MJ252_12925 [archaeon]|nr:hypothetical protein [archaeon]
MSKIHKIIHFPFKIFFSLLVMVLCFKNLMEINKQSALVRKNSKNILNRLNIKNDLLLQFDKHIYLIINSCFMISTVLLLIGMDYGKIYLYAATFLQLVFVNNPIFDLTSNNCMMASGYLGITAGLLSFGEEEY